MILEYTRSIVDAVLSHAERTPDAIALVFDNGDGPEPPLTYYQLAHQLQVVAASLTDQGLGGQRVGLLFSAGTEFVVTLLGCLAAGSIAAPIAPIGRRRARLNNILALLEQLEPAGVIVDDAMAGMFSDDLGKALYPHSIRLAEYTDLISPNSCAIPQCLKEHQLAVLQFTSGTTGAPKKVMITHGNIMANEIMIRNGFGHDELSHFVGWVPHYHDQGLFGNILQPLFLGSTCVLTSPAAFLKKPVFWLELISRYGAHTSGGPNFGYELCIRHAERRIPQSLDLSSWRVAFNGAERVQPRTLDRFVECFAPFGFDRRAFLPCYGLAECTLVSVAMPARTTPIANAYDTALLAAGEAEEITQTASSRVALACCGPALSGSEALIVDPVSRTPLANGKVGEIWLRGPHIAAGYLGDEEASEATFGATLRTGEGPYLRTGDLAFATGDGLYLVGRSKDTIIIGGRNYAPSDIEQLWAEAAGWLGHAHTAAVQIETEMAQHVVLVAEVKRTEVHDINDRSVELLAQRVRALAIERLELSVSDVIFVPEGSIPRTTSGKVQRLQLARSLMLGEVPWLAASGPLKASLDPLPELAAPPAE